MFATLPASGSRTRRTPLATLWSLAVHLGVIALAAQLAAVDVDGRPVPPPPDTIVFHLAPPPERTSTGPTTGEQEGSDRNSQPATPVRLPTAPVTVPIEIPPVDPAAPVIDGSTDWLSESARRSLTGGGDTSGRGAESRRGRGAIAIAERGALAVPGNPRPRYPEVLRAAALEGTVLAEFVIDTSGAVEVQTVQIIASDHPLFERAVRDILPHLRFLPAEAGGWKVRQLVRQPFEFRLTRVPR